MRSGLPLDHFDPDSEVVDAVRDEKIAAPINPELARAWRNLDTGALVVAVATEDNERGGEVLVFHRIPGAEFRDISYSIAAQHLRDVNVNGKPDLDSAYKTLHDISEYIDGFLSPAPNYETWKKDQER